MNTKEYKQFLLFVKVEAVSGGGVTFMAFMSKIKLIYTYNDIIEIENLLEEWKEFVVGKKNRKDVQEFQRQLMSNIISLHKDLITKKYEHSDYESFNISDPKPRNIHKAKVRDRLLHHALYRKLYQFFDRTFISDSYSCRFGKGTHKAIKRFEGFGHRVSKNNTKTVWILKCDIRKFFASIDQKILLEILNEYIPDKDISSLFSEIISSFYSTKIGVGLPLGNLTSQLLVNIYMNEFDQFVKHKIKTKYYIRYADDFVIFSENRELLEELRIKIDMFLESKLKLKMHPDKVFIKTLASGVDFLGWVYFARHRVLRTTTKRKMFRNIKTKEGKIETLQSYLGMLKSGNAFKLAKYINEL